MIEPVDHRLDPMSKPLPRATCPRCHRSVPVRTNGTLREHSPTPKVPARRLVCPGSGESPRPTTIEDLIEVAKSLSLPQFEVDHFDQASKILDCIFQSGPGRYLVLRIGEPG